jgi:hypothetical protein
LILGVSLANAIAPTATIEGASEITYNSAKATGHVDPADKETAYHFEFISDAQFNQNLGNSLPGFEGATQEGFGSLPENAGNTEVQSPLGGLSPATVYHLRLVASNADGEDAAVAASTFETEAVNAPEAEVDPVTTFTGMTAHLSGTVNSGGSGAGEKAGTYRFSCSPGCPGAEGSHEFQAEGFADGNDHAVQADATGLIPDTEYTVTLTSTNAGGEESDQTVFTTVAILPEVATAFAAPRTTTTARLNAYIDPNHSATTYYFQYGSQDCSANPCASIPLSEDAVAGSDLESHIVSEEVENLSEGTTYHYRVVAENAAGEVAGADKTFQTRTAAEMTLAPRGYEMVNPPDTGNQNVRPADKFGEQRGYANRPDGNSAAWSVSSGITGGTVGSGNVFLSTRTATGWTSRSLIGPADQQLGGGNKNFEFLAASSDLSHFFLEASEGSVNTGGASAIRTNSSGSQELLLTLPFSNLQHYVDASLDGRHLLAAAEDENGLRQLYDFGSGTPEEVDLMPNGSPPACGLDPTLGFRAGPEGNNYAWSAKTDASRVFFETPGSNCAGPVGVYVRNRETETTTQLTSGGTFIRATPDGRTAVFLSGGNIYHWSEGEPTKCLTCSVADGDVYANAGSLLDTIEASEDLSRIYFMSTTRLFPGTPMGEASSSSGGLPASTYVVHPDGTIHFVGPFTLVNSTLAPIKMNPDGRVVVFEINSDRQLTSDDVASECPRSGYQEGPHPCVEVYRYDDAQRSIECLSCVLGGVTERDSGYYGALVSDDGDTVAFETPEKLLPSDVNGGSDIYQWHNGKLGLITDGVTKFPGTLSATSLGAPTVAGIDATGENIFFTVAAPLTGFEQDGLANLYDSRIGGGFEAPGRPVHCEGDACQGSVQPPPEQQGASSATGSSRGNVASKARKRHHSKRKAHRHRHHHKRNRHATKTRKHG